MSVNGTPNYPLIIAIVGQRRKLPTGWAVTRGYELIKSGTGDNLDEGIALAHSLAIGDGSDITTVHVSHKDIRSVLHGVDFPKLGTEDEYLQLPPSIKNFAVQQAHFEIGALEGGRRPDQPQTDYEHMSKRQRKKYRDNLKLPRLTIATDASLRMGEGGEVAGMAWITEERQSAIITAKVGVNNITTAEMWAIHDIFIHMNIGRKLLIKTDSLNAIRNIRSREHILTHPEKKSSHFLEALEAINKDLKGRDVLFSKVKAHSGDELNEIADKLAKWARYCHENSISDEQKYAEADRIAGKPSGDTGSLVC